MTLLNLRYLALEHVLTTTLSHGRQGTPATSYYKIHLVLTTLNPNACFLLSRKIEFLKANVHNFSIQNNCRPPVDDHGSCLITLKSAKDLLLNKTTERFYVF